MDSIKYYSTPTNICSCRDKNGDFTKISKNFKNYYHRLKNGERGSDILTDLKIMRSCCRIKYLSIPLEPMIDRASERYTDNLISPPITENTRSLNSLVSAPDFPEIDL